MGFYKLLGLIIHKHAISIQKQHDYAQAQKMCAKNNREITALSHFD